MNIPYLLKYKPKTLQEFKLSYEIEDILNLFISINSLVLLIVGNSGTGKSTLIDCIINKYYDSIPIIKKNDNILVINNLSDQGIVYYRQTVYNFCQSNSTIPHKKKQLY